MLWHLHAAFRALWRVEHLLNEKRRVQEDCLNMPHALQGEDEQSVPAAPQESSKGSQGVLVQAS